MGLARLCPPNKAIEGKNIQSQGFAASLLASKPNTITCIYVTLDKFLNLYKRGIAIFINLTRCRKNEKKSQKNKLIVNKKRKRRC